MFHFILCILIISSFTVHGKNSDLPKDCGISKFPTPPLRIVAGEKARLGQYPWIAKLGKYGKKKLYFFCAGSLINRYYVVSAAHCNDDATLIRLGEYNMKTAIDCESDGKTCAEPHQDIEIKRFIINEHFCSPEDLNDISLIELKTAATLNDYVQPICLPSLKFRSLSLLGKRVYIAGWGMTNSHTGAIPDVLMHIQAPVVEKQECDSLFVDKLVESQLCIGYEKGKDSCGGDSGGPVSMNTKMYGKERGTLIGVVSYGLEDCGKGPAVYTSVSHYVDWIKKNVNKS